MGRKINSEIKYDNKDFKIKIGTTDKKKPESVYIEIGTYISPLSKKMNYLEEISYFEKSTKAYLKNKIKENNFFEKDNFITIIEIAEERINLNKKSYLEVQMYLKNTFEFRKNKIFKDLSNEIYDCYVKDSTEYIKNELESLGFEYVKNKK